MPSCPKPSSIQYDKTLAHSPYSHYFAIRDTGYIRRLGHMTNGRPFAALNRSTSALQIESKRLMVKRSDGRQEHMACSRSGHVIVSLVILIARRVLAWGDKQSPRSRAVPALWCSTVPFPKGPIKDEGRRKIEVITNPTGRPR